MAALAALDARLRSVVLTVSEPALAQLRLAWWRETLCASPEQWPPHDPDLIALRTHGVPSATALALVDAWDDILCAMDAPVAEQAQAGAGYGQTVFNGVAALCAAPLSADAGRAWGVAQTLPPQLWSAAARHVAPHAPTSARDMLTTLDTLAHEALRSGCPPGALHVGWRLLRARRG